MQFNYILVEVRDGIATITLNVPEKHNPLSEIRWDLLKAIPELSKDDNIHVLVVTGAGNTFSAGGDIDILKAHLNGTYEQTRYERLQIAGYGLDIFTRIDKPVIAAVNGPALGAGFSLLLTCDIRIASEKAKFGSVFISKGLIPDCALSYFLPRTVGVSKALELMFTGQIVDAQEAKTLGLVGQVVPHDNLMKTVYELAEKIAQQPPNALELTKRLVYRSMLADIANHLDWETWAQQMCMRTEDFRESIFAFLEKRPQPGFTGKPAPLP